MNMHFIICNPNAPIRGASKQTEETEEIYHNVASPFIHLINYRNVISLQNMNEPKKWSKYTIGPSQKTVASSQNILQL